MTFRFLACAGPPPAIADLEARFSGVGELRLRARSADFRLWTAASTPCLASEGGRPALVGLLADPGAPGKVGRLPAGTSADAGFVRDHWGAYALFASAEDGSLEVLRDPSGTVPLFATTHEGLQLYASGPDLLGQAVDRTWEPDLHFLRHWLTYPFLRTARTGVAGVREILPGTVARADREPELLWSPWAHMRAAGLPFRDAAAMLREALLQTVPMLLPDTGTTIVQLSGGLDSSIVAAALARAGRRFQAVTFATIAPDGDERVHARAMAGACGIELTELREEDWPVDFEAIPPPAFRPPPTALLHPYERATSAHLEEKGARWVLSGAGGDNLFASLNSAAPAVDAFLAEGVRAAGAAIADLSSLHGCTRWSAMRLALRKGFARPGGAWRREARFLAPDALLPAIDPHPWLPPPADAPPGKREHVLSLIGIQHFLAQRRPASAALFPLLSQPLLELCLSIPAHLWIHGGRDRAVAREAVRGLVPDSILSRRGKGRLESMFMRGYMAGRRQLETLLLDGLLRRHGLVDPHAILAYLRAPGQPADTGYIRLIEMAAAEVWLRSLAR